MIHFEGERDFPLSAEDTWHHLHDARFLVQCIPDVEKVNETSPERAVCVLRPGFSFVRGTLEVALQLVEAIPAEVVRVLLTSKGIGSSSEVEASVRLEASARGCRVHWRAEIKTLGGLLKAVPQGLIRGAAEKVIQDAWTRIETKLRAQSGSA